MRLSKPVFYIASALVLASCGGASKIAKLPLETTSGVFIPKTPERPTEDELKTWPHQDLLTTGYPGISLQKAYDILKGRKSEKDSILEKNQKFSFQGSFTYNVVRQICRHLLIE